MMISDSGSLFWATLYAKLLIRHCHAVGGPCRESHSRFDEEGDRKLIRQLSSQQSTLSEMAKGTNSFCFPQ